MSKVQRMFCLGGFIFSTVVSAAATTQTYQEGVSGYAGTRDTYMMAGSYGNLMVGANSTYISIGDTTGQVNTNEARALIKFTGLNIPLGATITSATLKLYITERGGSPTVGAYGLLKNFYEGNTFWNYGVSGETCWNYLIFNTVPWSVAGGKGLSASFTYDATGDIYQIPDESKTITGTGWVSFNVTTSFSNQYAHNREYGWLLAVTNPGAWVYTRFAPSEGTNPALRPILEVTFEPPPEGYTPRRPKIIFHGAVYDPSHILQNPTLAQQSPFDGTYFHGVDNVASGSGNGWINRSVFAPGQIQFANYSNMIQNSLAVLNLTDHPLKYNFLSVTTIPGTLSQQTPPEQGQSWEPFTMWWSDFSPVVNNIRIAAKVAKAAGLVGILLDVEPYYGTHLWDYGYQADAQALGKTLEETRQQVRVCAEQFIQAINAEYPDMTLLIIPGTYNFDSGDLSDAFFDGIFSAADPRMKIIDGQEWYVLTSQFEFRRKFTEVHNQIARQSTVPAAYSSRIAVSFGLWLERDGWSCTTPQTYVTPEQWETRLNTALDVSDAEYLWIYNWGGTPGKPDWWTKACLPQPYIDALIRARDRARQSLQVNYVDGTTNPRVPNYAGTRDCYLVDNPSNTNTGAATKLTVGKRLGKRYCTLVKFTGLQLPPNAEIYSARLVLHIREAGSTVQNLGLGVRGLLQDFTQGVHVDSPATVSGETTWNHLHWAWQPWNTPGAKALGSFGQFDGAADRASIEEDYVAGPLVAGQKLVLEVTDSFRDQFARGREYGWILDYAGNPAGDGTYVDFGSRELDNSLAGQRPKLIVTYGEAEPFGTLGGTVQFDGYFSDVEVLVRAQLFQNNALTRSENVVIDPYGQFYIADITPGTYDVALKGCSWLQKRISNVQIDGFTDLGTIVLVAGDTDGDNEITTSDLATVLTNMDKLGD